MMTQGESHFNSIKVRLEREGKLKTVTPAEFQFHKGTIRTAYAGKGLGFNKSFQFHKGTIRTEYHR